MIIMRISRLKIIKKGWIFTNYGVFKKEKGWSKHPFSFK